MSSEKEVEVITTASVLATRLAEWVNNPGKPPSLYMDIEGVNLGRHRSISLISIYVRPRNKVYVVDVDVLGREALFTTDGKGNSLNNILESPLSPKVVFDVRNGSNALFGLFKTSLNGIFDVQLMELALRKGSKDHLASFSSCVQKQHRDLSDTMNVVDLGEKSDDNRSLGTGMVRYSARKATMLASLWDIYSVGLKPPDKAMWRCLIRETTQVRIHVSKRPQYDPQSENRMRSAWNQEFIEEYSDNWNDDLFMISDGMVYDEEEDRWVDGGEQDYWDDDELDEYFDDYPDTARDCIGWEEDMIKNGSPF
ncbi:hypothetical protein AYO21_05566 [Fonsecaea monophora]|uniref:3'-5' exonuclease domain-containing protein n=1 Tax=Fonsecaea monophora TaxID=254056 RepID=A0A177F7W3_9EURO|nr:hypothetical protein AYO21_05566 [Fonsecaea monophora]KAH0845641.1 putative Exonuclease 3'-5' domain-containing protein 1 [Fonsecaea pedrosoi]OAG40283.1 hypothetical protein AYO21_05566 [Fonsecaea monophora]